MKYPMHVLDFRQPVAIPHGPGDHLVLGVIISRCPDLLDCALLFINEIFDIHIKGMR